MKFEKAEPRRNPGGPRNSARINCYLSKELWTAVQKAAIDSDLPMGAFMRRCLLSDPGVQAHLPKPKPWQNQPKGRRKT